MLLRSPDVINITAALARSAMSRTERPDRAGAGGGSVNAATCCGVCDLAVAASAGFGASEGVASASLTPAAGFGASASFGASDGGAAFAAFDSTLCGSDAANLSLNISGEIAATVSGFSIDGAGSGSAPKASLRACSVVREANFGWLTTGSA